MSGHEGTGWHMHGDHGPIHPEPKRPLPRHPLPDGSLSACYAADSTCRPVVVRTLDEDAERDARVAATARADALREAADEVGLLHHPESTDPTRCWHDGHDWPCPTVAALRAATEDPLPDG